MIEYTILKNSDKEAFVRVYSDGSGTVTLSLEKLCEKPDGTKFQQKFETLPLVVTLKSVQWAGDSNASIKLTRNGKTVIKAVAAPYGTIRFDGDMAYSESTESESDLVFEGESGECSMWVLLRKMNYHSFIEEANMGSYDDPEKVDIVY